MPVAVRFAAQTKMDSAAYFLRDLIELFVGQWELDDASVENTAKPSENVLRLIGTW